MKSGSYTDADTSLQPDRTIRHTPENIDPIAKEYASAERAFSPPPRRSANRLGRRMLQLAKRWTLREGLAVVTLTILITLPLPWIDPPTISTILQRHLSSLSASTPGHRHIGVDQNQIAPPSRGRHHCRGGPKVSSRLRRRSANTRRERQGPARSRNRSPRTSHCGLAGASSEKESRLISRSPSRLIRQRHGSSRSISVSRSSDRIHSAHPSDHSKSPKHRE
jgi:hypothetical protein